MFLFGLEGSGFIISLGLILLVAGAIMYYCLQRFSVLESSIIEQGRVLHTFINKIQTNNFAMSNHPYNIDANISNTLDETQNVYNNITEKIEVSDDDNDESDNESDDSSSNDESDYDSDNKSDDVSDNEDNISESNNKSLVIDETLNINADIKIVSMEDIQLNDTLNNTLNDILNNTLNDTLNDTLNISLINSEENSASDISSIIESNCKEIVELKNEVNQEIKKTSISKMKVSELREMAITQGLVNNMEDANKLKKDNLLKILQSEVI